MISFASGAVASCLTPKQILMGDGASGKTGELLDGWQIPKGDVLLAADREMARLGLNERVEKPLREAGYTVFRFDDIVGEPTLDTAVSLVSFTRRHAPGAVIGMGGGSAMDMAKLAAALGANTGDVADYLGATRFRNPPLPLALVPTTAGTGAESTAVSMLSVEGRKAIVVSPQLVPAAAVLDPLLTVTLPPGITAATGIDALSHALEGYLSVRANPFTDSQALTTLSLVARWLGKAFEDGGNLEARRAMSYAAFTGGLCLNAGVVLGHSAAYTIANRTRLPHGTSCAMALPFTLAFNLPAVTERLSLAAERVLEKPGAPPRDIILWAHDLNRRLGMPQSLKEIGLKPADLPEMIAECLTRYPRPTNPIPITRENLTPFYERLFEGDIEGCIETFGKRSA